MLQLQIITTKEDLKAVLIEVLGMKEASTQTDLTADKMNKHEVCSYLSISMPTLNKMIKDGKLREHTYGSRKRFMLKSEINQDLKNV